MVSSLFHARQFAAAHPIAQQVNGLVRDAALLKIALGLFRVKAFGFAPDLDLHGALPCSDFNDHGQHHGAAARGLIQIAADVRLHAALDGRPVVLFLPLAAGKAFIHDTLELAHECLRLFDIHKAAGNDLRISDRLAVFGRERDDGHHDAVLGQMTAVAQHGAADVTDAGAVDIHIARWDIARRAHTALGDLDHFAVFSHEHVLRLHAHEFADLGMLAQHPILAVHGDKVTRLRQREHHLQLLLAGMTGDVQRRVAVIDDLRALLKQLVNDAADRDLVARNGRGRDDDAVAGVDRDLFVLGKRHTVQRRHRLTLAAGADDNGLAARQAADLRHVHHDAVRNVHIAELRRNAHDVFHAAAGDADLALILCRHVDNLLQAMDIGRKRRDDDALVTVLKELIKAVDHARFRGAVAGTLHVRGVRQQREHALVAELAETRQVDHAALNGREVDLEVTRVDDGADRRFDRQRNGIGNAVVRMDELHLEAAELKLIARLFREDLRMVKQVMLFELELNDRRRQRRCIDRHVKLLEHIRDRANVVLVSVRDDHAADAVFVGLQVADVRDDHVNAVEVLIRKAHAAVDKEHILAILVNGEVLADLTEPAERDDFQFGCHSYLLYVRFRADCSPGSWLIFRKICTKCIARGGG